MATSDTKSVTSKVLEILAVDPSLSYSTLGGVVGVTREGAPDSSKIWVPGTNRNSKAREDMSRLWEGLLHKKYLLFG